MQPLSITKWKWENIYRDFVEVTPVKRLRGKEIALVKMNLGGPSGGSMTWDLESRMKKSYPELFSS